MFNYDIIMFIKIWIEQTVTTVVAREGNCTHEHLVRIVITNLFSML